MMNIYLSHSGNYDYEIELYNPLRSSSLVRQHDILFPHDKENVGANSKNSIAHSDLVIAEVSYPSTGQGIELGWANDSGTPILCFYKSESKLSSSLRFVSNDFIEYDSQQDMLDKLAVRLNSRQ